MRHQYRTPGESFIRRHAHREGYTVVKSRANRPSMVATTANTHSSVVTAERFSAGTTMRR